MNWTVSSCPPLKTYFQYVARNYYYDIFLISSFVVNALIAGVACFGNLMVMYTILRTSRLQTPSNTLVLGLAVSDFCSSITALPSFSLYKLFEYIRDTRPFCVFGMVYITSGTTLAVISFITLTFVIADRYLALILHLRYQVLVTPKLYAIGLVFIWITSVSAVVIRMFAYGVTFLLLTCIVFASLLFLNAFFVVRISKIVRRHSRQIRAQEQSVQQSIDMPKYKRSVNTMYYVTGAFALCYIPFALALFVIYLIPGFSLRIRTYFTVTETLVLVNCALNPIIYGWRIKELREACLTILPKIRKSRNTTTRGQNIELQE